MCLSVVVTAKNHSSMATRVTFHGDGDGSIDYKSTTAGRTLGYVEPLRLGSNGLKVIR